MLVILRANWFVEGHRIRRGSPPSQPVEVPDHLRDILPPGARIVEDEAQIEAIQEQEQAKTFSEMARSRTGRQSMVDFLQGPKPQPEPEPEPKPEPEPEPEIKELLKAAKAVVNGKPSRRGGKK